jgi:hypothetical protein
MATVDLSNDIISSDDSFVTLYNWSQESSTINCPSTKMVNISFTMGNNDHRFNERVYGQFRTFTTVNDMYKYMLLDYYQLFIKSGGIVSKSAIYPKGSIILIVNGSYGPNSFTKKDLTTSDFGWYWVTSFLYNNGIMLNPSRICNAKIVPDNAFPNINSLNVSFSITNDYVRIGNSINEPNYNPDAMNSTCLGMWINTWLTNYSSTNSALPSRNIILNDPKCATSTFTSNIPKDSEYVEKFNDNIFGTKSLPSKKQTNVKSFIKFLCFSFIFSSILVSPSFALRYIISLIIHFLNKSILT